MVPNDDSTDTWTAIIPTEQSRQAWAAIEPLAKQIRDAEGCTLDVARAKAMTQLMLANCTGTFHVHFAVPVDQAEEFAARFTGDPTDPPDSPASDDVGDAWAVVTGLGTSGTTIVPKEWIAEVLDGEHGDLEADVLGCDRLTGGFVAYPIPIPTSRSPQGRRRPMPKLVTTSYVPTSACRSYVKARDQQCRFPGCTNSAYFTDLDHVRPWPLGPTDPRNLACLCRRHHRIKQRPGWRVRLNPDGSMDWTDPTGQVRTTFPVDHLGTTLPRATGDDLTQLFRQSPDPSRGERECSGFGDAIWAGDYNDPDSYRNGLPVELAVRLDISEQVRAMKERRILAILHQEFDWALAPQFDPPEPLFPDVWWLAS